MCLSLVLSAVIYFYLATQASNCWVGCRGPLALSSGACCSPAIPIAIAIDIDIAILPCVVARSAPSLRCRFDLSCVLFLCTFFVYGGGGAVTEHNHVRGRDAGRVRPDGGAAVDPSEGVGARAGAGGRAAAAGGGGGKRTIERSIKRITKRNGRNGIITSSLNLSRFMEIQ